MKKVLFLFIISAFVSSGLLAQALYSSTAYTSRFNPGLGSCGTPIVAYDDVSIPSLSSYGSDSINITKINVGIRRTPNAPATNVNIYYSTFEGEAGTVGSNNHASNVFLGTVSLPVNGPSLITSVITLGDSVTTLFKIKKGANVTSEGYDRFLIGASFDNPSPANGIVLTREEGNNLGSIWVVNPDSDKSAYATNFSGRLPASYYLEVFGASSQNPFKEEGSSVADVAVNRPDGALVAR